MSNEANQAARVTGPVSAADATHRTGVVRVQFTGSAQNIALPTSGAVAGAKSTLARRFIRIAAVGGNCQWAFSTTGSAVTIVSNQATTIGTGHVSAGATLFNSVPEQLLVPKEATHLCFLGDNATGYLEFYVSDQSVV